MANIFRYLAYGYAPDVYDEYLLTGDNSTYTKSCITRSINEILSDHTGKKFKIGKTGDASVRVDMTDYRGADFDKMFLLFEHDDPAVISTLEAHYIQKYKTIFPRRCSNIQMHSGGGMYSPTGYYYLYIVT